MSTDLVRLEPKNIAPALVEAGVEIREEHGVRHVFFPDSLRERFNVLQPVTALVVADPLWSPSVRAVTLDVAEPKTSPHVYPGTRSGYLALSKLGNALIGDAAGAKVEATEPFHAGLRDRQFGWRATVVVRMGDGTYKRVTESHVTDLDDELEAIEAQVLKIASRAAEEGNPWTETAIAARVKERWVKEKPHFQAKGETKAVLRAMRLIMQVQHEYPAAALRKPFLVVGFSMTPDYSDPDTRRLLLEAGVAATSRAYGSSSPGHVSSDELERQAEPEPEGEPFDPATEPGPEVVDVPPSVRPAPEPERGRPGSGDEAARFAEAARYPIRMGKHRGKTIQQLDAEDGGRGYLEWLNARSATTHDGRMLAAMISTYLEGQP